MFLIGLLICPAILFSAQEGQRYALLIGIGSYAQWAPLANPIPDVRALEAELRYRYGFLPEVLENPNREAIIAKLRRYLRKQYGPNDQLIIVFAGHGTYDEVSRIGYLVASDSSTRHRDPNFVSLLNFPWLLKLVDNIDCPNILLIVDACYSGSLRDAGSATRRRSGESVGWVRQYLTAGGEEYVSDGEPDRHTPFVRRLLEGLRSSGRRGVLPLDELYSEFMHRAAPTPRWGSFGRHSGSTQFTLKVRGSAPPPRFSGGELGNQSVLAPVAAPLARRLRAEPARLSDREIERAFIRLEIFDTTRNPEGNFPNQFRRQTQGHWDVVLDLKSELMWQQDGSEYRVSPEEAADYVRQLNSGAHAGYRDWRLPTVEELASLLEPRRQADGLFISSQFDTEQEVCWSADSDSPGTHAYYVSFNAGRAILGFGSRKAFVRAVRNN